MERTTAPHQRVLKIANVLRLPNPTSFRRPGTTTDVLVDGLEEVPRRKVKLTNFAFPSRDTKHESQNRVESTPEQAYYRLGFSARTRERGQFLLRFAG